jgi:hypothetical protein
MEWTIVVGFLVGTLVPFVFMSLLPNSKFHAWGVSTGKKLSAAGTKIVGGNWENLENNLTGSFISFAKGVEEGANEDG